MIVLDTTVLVCAVGVDLQLRAPCQELRDAVAEGVVSAATTIEVIQEFARTPGLGCFDAVLAAAAMARGADALASTDRAFADVPGLTAVLPTAEGIASLLAK